MRLQERGTEAAGEPSAPRVEGVTPVHSGSPGREPLVRAAMLASAEVARVLAVLLAGLYVVRPLLEDRWFGDSDQLWYLSTFQDFIFQARAGTFPAIVGQTPFSFNGYPIVQTIVFYDFGVLLDMVTLHGLDGVALLYGTIACFLAAGGIAAYLAFVGLFPDRRWLAAAVAVIYQLSPALLAPIYDLDLTPTMMSIPAAPVMVYGLVRFVRGPSLPAYVAIAGAFALIVATNPAEAMWVGLLAGVLLGAALVVRGRRWSMVRGLVWTALLFIGLAAGYVLPVLDLHMTSDPTFTNRAPQLFMSDDIVQAIWGTVQAWFPDELHPLVGQPDITSQQLGFSLFLLVALGLVQVLRRRAGFELALLLLVLGVGAVYLAPIPVVTLSAYRFLPSVFNATGLWPEHRLHIILAALAATAGMCALGTVKAPSRRWSTGLCLLLLVACAWSAQQAQLFVDLAEAKMKAVPSSTLDVEAYAAHALSRFSVYNVPGYTGPVDFGSGFYDAKAFDPALDNALIDRDAAAARPRDAGSDGYPLLPDDPVPSNLAAALQQGANMPSVPIANAEGADPGQELRFSVDPPQSSTLSQIASVQVQPGTSYLLTFQSDLTNVTGVVLVYGLEPEPAQTTELGSFQQPALHVISMSSSRDFPVTANIWAELSCFDQSLPCQGGLSGFRVQTYDPETLPVHLLSLFPYRAEVTAPAGLYLDTHRAFFPGYVAHVNGMSVDVLKSQRGRVEIPLSQGMSTVDLDYVPTLATRMGWAISICTWLGATTAMCVRAWRQRRRATAPLVDLARPFPLAHRGAAIAAAWAACTVIAIGTAFQWDQVLQQGNAASVTINNARGAFQALTSADSIASDFYGPRPSAWEDATGAYVKGAIFRLRAPVEQPSLYIDVAATDPRYSGETFTVSVNDVVVLRRVLPTARQGFQTPPLPAVHAGATAAIKVSLLGSQADGSDAATLPVKVSSVGLSDGNPSANLEQSEADLQAEMDGDSAALNYWFPEYGRLAAQFGALQPEVDQARATGRAPDPQLAQAYTAGYKKAANAVVQINTLTDRIAELAAAHTSAVDELQRRREAQKGP